MCKWLSVAEVAERLRCNTSTVYRWVKRGLLRSYVTPGGTLRICEGDILRPSRRNTMRSNGDPQS